MPTVIGLRKYLLYIADSIPEAIAAALAIGSYLMNYYSLHADIRGQLCQSTISYENIKFVTVCTDRAVDM